MTALNEGLFVPDRMRALPVDTRGYPVPWFVTYVNGEPDFRLADPDKFTRAIRYNRCWVCGDHNGAYKVFVVGPISLISGVHGEPPCHRDCAEYSVQACPFLARPAMRRREKGLPEGGLFVDGIVKGNPGVSVLWSTKRFRTDRGAVSGTRIFLGSPEWLSWWREGRAATREEAATSLDSGRSVLLDEARAHGPDGLAVLDQRYQRAVQLLPKEVTNG